ncbi:LacI family DNA-binding transcriptional regulator [Stackebrandtia nassauensis]|uniref:Transcriptional regulator, LacI family n=1 Tax=Stackebrandtia nassauensis (strain DSM 44728 / CIP 108903 / NRRL B-16338 / NBRC 102104 / LLR-40K-21) TaxID=446470 RepID=D3Q0H1_STANL|nr:LacI family DNA-binding transcriptional regulator [Stackebrandtia nassauensis]ADD41707.1 transcriptional regulator, LacI family [Stackebrandtia nassauensis DSM 44728]
MGRPTIADIAAAAGVSKSAVSFALNGRPGVSDETRAAVLKIAEELDWMPHSAARALSGSRSHSIGLALARPARTLGVEPFFTQLLSGIQAKLSERSIALQLLIVEDAEAEIATYRRWAGEHRVDGLVLVDPQTRDRRIAAVEALSVPAVVVGGNGRSGTLASVWADDRAAMLSIVDYLVALGHKRLAHVSGMPGLQHTRRRAKALKDTVASHKLLSADSLSTDFSDAEGAAATRRLLSGRARPSAIVYDNDVMAVAGLGVATEMGVTVPGELSIVSFEDSRLTQLTHPAITSLSRDTYAFGEKVAETLLAVIDDPAAAVGHKMPTPSLTVRESTARPLDNNS